MAMFSGRLGVLGLVVALGVLAGCRAQRAKSTTTAPQRCRDLAPQACFQKGLELERQGDPDFWEHFRLACDRGAKNACMVVIGRIDEKVRGGIKDDRQLELLRGLADGYCRKGYQWACNLRYRIFSTNSEKRREEVKLAMEYHRKRCSTGGILECKELVDLLGIIRTVFRHTYTTTQFEINELACSRGYGDGCYNIGWENWRKRRFDRAFEYYLKACSLGSAQGCSGYLGNITSAVVQGLGDYRGRSRGLEKLCGADNQEACGLLARGHLFGWWHGASAARGAGYLRKACLAGDAGSCDELAALYLQGKGVKKDIAKARLILAKSCYDGQNASCVELAEGERNGAFGTKNARRAADLLTAVCKSSYRRPHYSGHRYRRRYYYNDYYYYNSPSCGMLGHYIVTNLSNAFSTYNGERFMTNACSKGHQRYCYLAGMYFHRIKRSSYYYLYRFKNACTAGYTEACVKLYDIYSRGDGLAKSEYTARGYRSMACRLDPSLKICK